MPAISFPHRWPVAWHMAFRESSPWFAAISGAALLITMLFPDLRGRSLELVLPLAAGIQAALLFSPDDEPALETLLAAPRPAPYLIYERLAAVFVIQGAVGLAGTVLASVMVNIAPLTLLVGWLPPTIAIMGLGLLATFVSRRSSAGVLAVILVTLAMLAGADLLLMRFPALFPLHFFFQPVFAQIGAEYFGAAPELLYAINRIVIALLGVLAMLRVMMGMRNTEAVLGANHKTD